MIIAGIDYSITSPCLCVNDNFYYFTKIKKYQMDIPRFKGFSYPDTEDDVEKFDIFANKFLEIILEYDVDAVFIEGYSYASKGLVYNIGENGGILKLRLKENNIHYFTPTPSQIKKFATGKGNCSKEMMHNAFHNKTSFNLEKIGFSPNKNPSSDIVDSYFIQEYGYFVNQKK